MIYESELRYLKEQERLGPRYAKSTKSYCPLFKELPSKRTLNRLFTYDSAGTVTKNSNSKVYGRGANDTVSIPKVGSFPCYRIIWAMHNGRIPYFKVIDHEDRNRFNNKSYNLRPLSIGDNVKNSLPPGKIRATSVPGVILLASGKYRVKFACASSLSMSAEQYSELERKRKIFPTYTRTFDNFFDAVAYRKEASITIENLHGFVISNPKQTTPKFKQSKPKC